MTTNRNVRLQYRCEAKDYKDKGRVLLIGYCLKDEDGVKEYESVKYYNKVGNQYENTLLGLIIVLEDIIKEDLLEEDDNLIIENTSQVLEGWLQNLDYSITKRGQNYPEQLKTVKSLLEKLSLELGDSSVIMYSLMDKTDTTIKKIIKDKLKYDDIEEVKNNYNFSKLKKGKSVVILDKTNNNKTNNKSKSNISNKKSRVSFKEVKKSSDKIKGFKISSK